MGPFVIISKMASGVKVAEETVSAYNDVKMKHNIRYVIMHIEDGLVKVLKTQEKAAKDSEVTQEQEFNEFVSQLPQDIGRYCILDLCIPTKSGATKDQLFIITWCPSNASMKSNILYTTSKKALLDRIREGMVDVQANDPDDLVYSEILEKYGK